MRGRDTVKEGSDGREEAQRVRSGLDTLGVRDAAQSPKERNRELILLSLMYP